MPRRAKGCIIKFGGSGGTAIARLRSLSGPSGSVETLDVSSHDMTSLAREFMGTLVDQGTVGFSAELSATNINTIETIFQAAEAGSIQISFPFATPITATFNAVLTARTYNTDGQVAGELLMEGELQISGDITWAGLS